MNERELDEIEQEIFAGATLVWSDRPIADAGGDHGGTLPSIDVDLDG